jgi:hypothetical protein
VWIAEQRKEAEAQKTKELAKQIQQEREEEELEKISGKKGPKLDRGIDWMYQGSTGELAKEDSERKAEEFLLGKEFVGDGATQGDFDNGDQDQGINTVLRQQEAHAAVDQGDAAASSSAFANEPSVKDRNEDFRMRVEDPMFMVSQKQHEKEVRHDKTKALYERVVGYHEDGNGGDKPNNEEDRVLKKKKASKKEKKRHKKQKTSKSSKHNRDHEDDSDDSCSGDDTRRRQERHRQRSRSPNLDRHRSKRHKRSPSYDRHRSRSDEDEDSRHIRRDRHRSHRGDEDRYSKRSRHDHHDREEVSSSRGRRSSRRDRSDSEDDHKDSRRTRRQHDDDDDDDRRRHHDDRDHKRHHDDKHREHHDRRHSRNEDRTQHGHHHSKPAAGESPAHTPKKEGYGLKGASVTVDRGNLGPSRDLLAKKRDEREAERRKIRETASSRGQRTAAERAKALEEMQANARKREESRSKGHDSKKYDDEGEPSPRKGADASFLKDITRQTHGIGEGSQTLASRVAQNRHTNQRLHDSFF